MTFILILIFLLFLPLPIKLDILYKEFIVDLKIYNKPILSFDLRNIPNHIDSNNEKNKINSKISFIKRYLENKQLILKDLFLKLNSNKFKPFINMKTNIDFGISDAAICAIVYGLLWNLTTIIRIPLNLIFNIKDISLSINPKFNTNYLLFSINSIFYISLANIIYIIFLLFKSFKNKEEIINE